MKALFKSLCFKCLELSSAESKDQRNVERDSGHWQKKLYLGPIYVSIKQAINGSVKFFVFARIFVRHGL